MKNKIGIAAVIVVVAMFCCLVSRGETFTWTNALGDGDWTKPGNFVVGSDATGEVATAAPGASDDVYIPIGTTVTLEYDVADADRKASCEAFAAVSRVFPYAGDVIDITVPDGETLPLACAVSCGTSESDANAGRIVKRGSGELDLNSVGKVTSGGEYYDYNCSITVDEGVLRLPQIGVDGHFHVGTTDVGKNGVLFTAATSSSTSTKFYSLNGSGLVTNDHGISRLQIATRSVFYGRLGGSILYYSSGWLTLGGSESTASAPSLEFSVYQNFGRGVASDAYGCVEVATFGRKAVDGVSTPSSIGYSETIQTRDNGGAFRYIGTGETTDKDLRIWPQTTDYPTYLDGGPHGGLVWTGLWGQRDNYYSTFQPMMIRLVLQGSNTAECVMSGKIECRSKGGTNYTFCITKQGTGTWRMAHNDDSDMRGAWRIVDGTLRYDTIAEVGVNSALGKSSVLYANKGAYALDENKVDYAFWLGGGSGGNRANLEYVGTTNCISSTRRFAVTGTGGVLNNGEGGFLRLSDFVATNTPSTLVLGGSNSLDNAADCIADGGNAQMSVVKEGSGTWRLGTNCTFTGSLDVKEGTLIVGNPLWGYYRWVIKATYNTTSTSGKERYVGLKSFGLFDADGNDRIFCLSHDGDWYANSSGQYCSNPYSYSKTVFGSDSQSLAIDEGHFRITYHDGKSKSFTTGGNADVSNLFAHVDYNPTFYSRTPQSPPLYESTNHWIVFTMRPKTGAPIASWDYVNAYYNATYQMISNCVLEASVDGASWTKIDEVTNDTEPTRNTWQSDNSTSYVVGYATHATGMKIPSGPTNVVVFAPSSVSVANGAVLKSQSLPERPVIRELAVDASTGGGTIDGFELASDLTLKITNMPSGGATIPVTFKNVTGLDDISGWTLNVDGRAKSVNRLSASAAGFTVTSPGTVLIVF